MSNDKHPDHHFDDELIAQLYESSKEEMQPSTDLDDLILSTLNETAGDNVVDVDGSIDANVVSLLLSKDEGDREPQSTFKRKKWFVPNSLVACLVVSVMVGLIYRENADKLLISDPKELDYAIPMPSVERRISTKAKAVAFDEDQGAESEEVSAGFKGNETQEHHLLMDSASSYSGLRSKVQGASVANAEASVIKKQEVSESEPSMLQDDEAVVPSVIFESKGMAARKAKKSKPKPMMQQMAPSRMLMMAPPIQAEKRVSDTIDFDVEFNKIRKLRDGGDMAGARALLDILVAKYPSMELPADIVLLKESFK